MGKTNLAKSGTETVPGCASGDSIYSQDKSGRDYCYSADPLLQYVYDNTCEQVPPDGLCTGSKPLQQCEGDCDVIILLHHLQLSRLLRHVHQLQPSHHLLLVPQRISQEKILYLRQT
uniref:Uncharacterized protein n=1 Tax=Ditylum brightwellii TaxID=49249 RepID=A0A7S4S852_9STRA